MAKLTIGALTLDTETRILETGRGHVRLAAIPFTVAERLLRRAGVIVSMDDLISTVWPEVDDEPEHPENLIRRTVGQIRTVSALLGVQGNSPGAIVSERGVGYYIRTERVQKAAKERENA